MAQVVPDVARFELKYRTTDDVVENVYYARISGGAWDETNLDAVEAVFENWETVTANLYRGDQVELFEIIATDLSSLFGVRKAYSISPPVAGALADTMPANSTIAVKASIGRRGRGTSGRSFWVGLAQGQLASMDQLSAAAAGNIVGALNTLRTAVAAVTPVEGLCVPHFVVGGSRPPTVIADIITEYLLSDFYMDSQRDRLPGHKKHKTYPIA